MVTVLPDPSGLAEGITQAGSALAQALQQRGERQRQQQYGTILNKIISGLPEDASPLQVMQGMSQALAQGVPVETVKDTGTLYKALQKKPDKSVDIPDVNEMSGLFQRFGMEEDEANRNAELYSKLTAGGQTEMAKMLIDRISRGQNVQQPVGQPQIQPQQDKKKEPEAFDFPKVDIFEDRTPKERTQLKTELLKSNNVRIDKTSEAVRKSDELINRYNQLESLNESGKLPEGLENLNINWTTGDIRFPKLANPETQAYVKTINDFTTAAKDTFGARVTNFELGAFMKRLPTLANSTDGRRLILNQMRFKDQVDGLYDKSLLKVYDNYGTQKIDFSNADKIARKMIEDETDVIREKAKDNLKMIDIKEARELAPEGKIPALDPQGKVVYVWRNKADKAEKRGYKIQ